MAFWNAIPIVGKVIEGITGVIDELVEDKDEANKLKATLQKVAMQMDMTKFATQIQAQMNVIVAEAKGGWLQRNWRPMTMCVFVFIIANNYVIYPYLSLFWDEAPILDTPPELWSLLKLGLGGYVVGRSGEKIASTVAQFVGGKKG